MRKDACLRMRRATSMGRSRRLEPSCNAIRRNLAIAQIETTEATRRSARFMLASVVARGDGHCFCLFPLSGVDVPAHSQVSARRRWMACHPGRSRGRMRQPTITAALLAALVGTFFVHTAVCQTSAASLTETPSTRTAADIKDHTANIGVLESILYF